MRRLLVALAFLTRLPVPGGWLGDIGAADVARATLAYPLVGALVGGLTGLVGWGLATRLPPLLAAVLAVGCLALWTGALHLDGLADTADGLGGGRTREDALRIMKDHAVGAFGVVALVVLLGVKVAALATLLGDPARAMRALVVAGALSRWSAVPLAVLLPYARAGGGTGAALERAGFVELVGATLGAGALAWVAGPVGLWAAGAVVALTIHDGLLFRRRLGGYTGDTLGAQIEAAEAAALVIAVAVA